MTNYYIGPDGSIHSRGSSSGGEHGSNGRSGSVNTNSRNNNRRPAGTHRGVYDYGSDRKTAFWATAIIGALIIAAIFNVVFVEDLFGKNIVLMVVGVLVTIAGSVAGASFFGKYYGAKHRYNIDAFILVISFAILATVVSAFATLLIVWLLSILKYVFAVLLVLLIIGLL